MRERRGPLAEFLADYVERAKSAARALREEARRAGIHLPPSQLGQTGDEDVTSLVQPTDPTTVDVDALKARLQQAQLNPVAHSTTEADSVRRQQDEARARVDDRRRITEGADSAAVALAGLRSDAEALLDGVGDDDTAEEVVTAALKVLGRVQEVVVRELGHDWRAKVRPFGALARRKGTRVGAAWVGDGDVEPIALADAVELLAVDRAQFRREADESRTQAGEAVAGAQRARHDAYDAKRQVDEIRRLLDETLRPNAHTAEWCDTCQDEGVDCEDHRDGAVEPALSADLADEVRRVIGLWREAQDEARAARRGRVSVYVGEQLVTGPEVRPEPVNRLPEEIGREVHHAPVGDEATACNLLAANYHTSASLTAVTCPRCVAVVATRIGARDADPQRVYPWPCVRTDVHPAHYWQGTPPGYVGADDWRCPGRLWAETPEAREAVHFTVDHTGKTACGLPVGDGEDYRTTARQDHVNCAHCAVILGLPASQILDRGEQLGADVIRDGDDTGAVIRLQPPHYTLPGEAGERYKVVAAGAANLGGRTVTVHAGDTLTSPSGVVIT